MAFKLELGAFWFEIAINPTRPDLRPSKIYRLDSLVQTRLRSDYFLENGKSFTLMSESGSSWFSFHPEAEYTQVYVPENLQVTSQQGEASRSSVKKDYLYRLEGRLSWLDIGQIGDAQHARIIHSQNYLFRRLILQ